MSQVVVTVRGKHYQVFLWNDGRTAYIETFKSDVFRTIWHAANNRPLGPIAAACIAEAAHLAA